MNTRLAVLVLLLTAFTLSGATCLGDKRVGETVASAGVVVQQVAPALPGPWGGIAAVAGTLLTVVGSFWSKGKVNEAYSAGGPTTVAALSPVTKMLAERKWILPLIGAIVAGGNAANLWYIDTGKLVALLTALGIPSVGEFVKDAMTKRTEASSSGPATNG